MSGYRMNPMELIREEFEKNGTTKDLDELDLFMIRCRDRKWVEVDAKMGERIEKTRRILGTMKPLPGKRFCVFCKNNKEKESTYTTHVVKDEKGRVTCPILYRYICPLCHATGENAHTIKYCTQNDGITSVGLVFKTNRNGTGRIRKSSC